MKNAPVLCISLALTLCLTSLSAWADSVDFSFEGTVTEAFPSMVNPYELKIGDTVTVTGTYDDAALTDSGEESVLFDLASGNMLEIDVAPFIYDETDDDRYQGGGFPVLRFLDGSLLSFDFEKKVGADFVSEPDEFVSPDNFAGTWHYASFDPIPVDDDDDNDGVPNDDDLCPDAAMGDAVDAVGCSAAQVDRDGDSVCDPNAVSSGPGICTGYDICPDNTQVAEGVVPTVRLNPNHWALIDDDYVFDTVLKGKGKGPNRSYTIEDTHGCSCEQIIYMQGLGAGHTKFGCSISAMDDWVELVNP